jgi:hypothetical protein
MGFHSQVGSVSFKLTFRDVLTEQPIVAFLQGGQVIPDNTGDVEGVMQAKITLGHVQAVLVGFMDFDYACHALTPLLSESQWARQRRDWQSLYCTKLLFDVQAFTPYIPTPKGGGFTAIFR